MVLIAFFLKILILLVIFYYTFKLVKRAQKRGELLAKKEDLDFQKELYKEFESEIEEDKIKEVKESREGIHKFKNI